MTRAARSRPSISCTTISGLVLDELGRFPHPGEIVSIDGWEIEILAIERHRIQRVTLRRTVGDDGSDGGGRTTDPADPVAAHGDRADDG